MILDFQLEAHKISREGKYLPLEQVSTSDIEFSIYLCSKALVEKKASNPQWFELEIKLMQQELRKRDTKAA